MAPAPGRLFSTIPGVENEPLDSPETIDLEYERDLGWPGLPANGGSGGGELLWQPGGPAGVWLTRSLDL